MRFLVDDDMSRCTADEVARLLPLVDVERRQQAMRYKHVFGQYCCLRSWQMLEQLIGAGKMEKWQYNEYGKPYMNHATYFSISHCRQAILVAVSDKEIGVDIESLRHVEAELQERTMNTEEQAAIASAAEPERAFVRLWTQKEAVLKCRGTGIIDELPGVLEELSDIHLQTVEPEGKGYIFSIAEKEDK